MIWAICVEQGTFHAVFNQDNGNFFAEKLIKQCRRVFSDVRFSEKSGGSRKNTKNEFIG